MRMMPRRGLEVRRGASAVAHVMVLMVLALQIPSASAPLGSFCATEERGCFRDCYDPAKKQYARLLPGPRSAT
eukprot:COSAG02_NODE_28419_length_590_cov_0.698574_1_plen_72_part_10